MMKSELISNRGAIDLQRAERVVTPNYIIRSDCVVMLHASTAPLRSAVKTEMVLCVFSFSLSAPQYFLQKGKEHFCFALLVRSQRRRSRRKDIVLFFNNTYSVHIAF